MDAKNVVPIVTSLFTSLIVQLYKSLPCFEYKQKVGLPDRKAMEWIFKSTQACNKIKEEEKKDLECNQNKSPVGAK